MAGDNNYSLGPVPNTARKGVASLTMVMLGLTFFSASMWTGGSLGTGLSFNDFFLAVLIGNSRSTGDIHSKPPAAVEIAEFDRSDLANQAPVIWFGRHESSISTHLFRVMQWGSR